MTDKQLAQCAIFADKIFKSKNQMRKIFAKEPLPEKIKDLLRLQDMFVALHPQYKNILPWRI